MKRKTFIAFSILLVAVQPQRIIRYLLALPGKTKRRMVFHWKDQDGVTYTKRIDRI